MTIAVAVAAAPSAAAGVTRVTWPVGIVVRAAPATQNYIVVDYRPFGGSNEDWANYIFDAAGITTTVTEAPTCYPNGPKEVFCPDGAAVGGPGPGESIDFYLRDGGDVWSADDENTVGDFAVYGGRGPDTLRGHSQAECGGDIEVSCFFTPDNLFGGPGNDDIIGEEGPDFLYGGPGRDFLRGDSFVKDADRDDSDNLFAGRGRDRVDAWDGNRDRRIYCGRGRDRVVIDRGLDPRPKGCEVVIRRVGSG